MKNDLPNLNDILQLTHELLLIQDIDLVLENILKKARKIVSADAGSIYIKQGVELKFSYAQNATLQKKLGPGKKLIYTTFTIPVDNNSIAGYVANTGEIINIADVYQIDPAKPYSFGRHIDQISGYRTKSILTIPIKNSRQETIGVIQLINALNKDGSVRSFTKDEEPLIQYFAANAAVAIERAQMTRAIILRMIAMAELHDPKETGSHANRVAAFAVEIYETWAKSKNIPEKEIEHSRDILRMAAMLHDVGKIAISDNILKKPGPLDSEEVATMQQHTVIGARLFQQKISDFDDASSSIALNHHEKWDGTGYPGNIDASAGGKTGGKKGEEIPIFARIVALADVYDALIHHRSYKEAWDEKKVLETIKAGSGKHFDPEVVAAFFGCLDAIDAIRKSYPD